MKKAIIILENKYIDEKNVNELLRGGYTLYTTSLSIYNKHSDFVYDNSLAKLLKKVIAEVDFFSFGEVMDESLLEEISSIYPDIIIPSDDITDSYYVESGPRESLIINSLLKNNNIESYWFATSLLDNEKAYHSVFMLLQEANKFVIVHDDSKYKSGIVSLMVMNDVLKQYSLILDNDKVKMLSNFSLADISIKTNCVIKEEEKYLLGELLREYDVVYFRTKYKGKLIGCNITEFNVSKDRRNSFQKLNNSSVAYATKKDFNIANILEEDKVIYISQCIGSYNDTYKNNFMKTLDLPVHNSTILKKVGRKILNLVKKP